MKAILIIKFCVALLLTYVPDGVRTETINEILSEMANKEEVIDGIFKPSKVGRIGFGLYDTIIYKGELFLPNNIKMDVAMKFSESPQAKEALQNEYKIYTYLNAINDSSVEAYSIPSIHYYGTWNNCTMMAMSLLNSPFRREIVVRRLHEDDLLIALREFMRAIRYIHSLGIVNNDIKIENMMSANGRGFMFDFGESMGMTKSTRKEYKASTKRDFQQFLSSQFKGTPLWDIFQEFIDDEKNNGNKHSSVNRVFEEFAEYAYNNQTQVFANQDENAFPFYDYFYQVINHQLNNGEGEASSSFSVNGFTIPYIFETFLWPRPPVNYEHFEPMYFKRIQDARTNNRRAES